MKWFDALPLPLALATGETNPAFRALTGLEVAWPEAVHPADRERVEAAVARASASGESLRLEAHLQDGRPIRVEGVAAGDDLYTLTWCTSRMEQESAARFAAFMEHVPTVASLKDAEGRYLWVNRAFETYTGLTLGELRGKTAHDWMPQDRADESLALGRRVVEKLETFEEIASIPHVGRERVFLNTIFPVAGPNGVEVGLVAQDVTELIEHEHALEYNAQLQHAVVELGRQILRGLPDFLNAACESVSIMLGTDFTAVMEDDHERGDVVICAADGALRAACGLRIGVDECGVREMSRQRQAIVSVDLATERRFLTGKPALAAGARSSLRVSIRGGEGQYGVLATYATTPRDFSQSEIDCLESVANMLAAAISRRLAEGEIAEQRQELEALIDHAPDLIIRFERDRTMSFVNDVCRLGGWDPAQLLGRRITDLDLPPGVTEAWTNGIESVFRTGEPCTFETASGDGNHVVEVRLAPERAEEANVVRVLGISRDITDRIRAEQERVRLQGQLEQTRRAASVGRLGTTVAHEFNNVLMSISPFAEIISRSGQGDERLQKAAAYIRSAIARGRRVTHDIMRYTRPAEPARRTIDVASWLPGIIQSTVQACSTLGIDVDVPASPLYADVDPQQLEQVVANLLINAQEALADQANGNIRIQLTAGATSLRLRIEDNGPGIAPQSLDKLFEPFFTTKRSGTGLGLAVAQQIVERHGGTIGVESSAVTGTSFTITLPHAVAPPAQPVAAAEQTIRGRQLLLVEDEVAVADGIVALLGAGAAGVRIAPTGGLAITELERQLPEAVLLDVGLPDIDGVDLFALMRLHWPKLPIIFSTGHGDQARLESMLRLPHVAHLVKPFDLDDLTVAVASAIAG